jgi:hypothetical protein
MLDWRDNGDAYMVGENLVTTTRETFTLRTIPSPLYIQYPSSTRRQIPLSPASSMYLLIFSQPKLKGDPEKKKEKKATRSVQALSVPQHEARQPFRT